MTSSHGLSRKNGLAAGAAILGLAIALPWAIFRLTARSDSEARELLRRATEPDPAADAAVRTGKTTEVTGTTSSGEAIRADMTAIQSRSGRTVGFLPHLRQPLKEGESATLKVPGGGHIVIGPAGTGAAPSAPSTQPGSRP
jgi:hypothetical protein